MPYYEYRCQRCEADFEELLLSRADAEQFKDSHPCPICFQLADRIRVSVVGFQFAGGVRGTSGVHGQSGSHDLDYPTMDKAVGRSAEKRWKLHGERQQRILEARRGDPTVPVTIGGDGSVKQADSGTMFLREAALNAFKKAKGEE